MVVARTFAWLNQFRRLRVWYDKRADINEALFSLGCVWIAGSRCARQNHGLTDPFLLPPAIRPYTPGRVRTLISWLRPIDG